VNQPKLIQAELERQNLALRMLIFDSEIELANDELENNLALISNCEDFESEYDFSQYDSYNSQPVLYEKMSIEIGGSEHPRFSCACHKCNISVRSAIKKHKKLARVLAKLSKYAGKVKNSILLIQSHIDENCKLRCENCTSWNSSFLMLLSFKLAYKSNAFSKEFPCPVSKEVIDKYLQILLPAYKFTLIMEKNDTTIAELVPSLMIMLSKWRRMEVSGEYKNLVDLLVRSFEYKFHYECNSPIYHVAALLNTSRLPLWYNRYDMNEIKKSARDNILKVHNQFVKLKKQKEATNVALATSNSNRDELDDFLIDSSYIHKDTIEDSLELSNFSIKYN
jgi:hypothetical protein